MPIFLAFSCTDQRAPREGNQTVVSGQPIKKAEPVPFDAQVRVVTPDAKPTRFEPTTPVDLLYETPAIIRLSSQADSQPRAEVLVDRNMSTAWLSKSGDMKASISFSIPTDATIAHLSLTVGYNRIENGSDLFTTYARIKRVRLERGQSLVGEFTLETSLRSAQQIRFNGPGGDYKLTVLETVAGTKADLQQIAVSEFHVIGTPGKTRREAREPLLVHVTDRPEVTEQSAVKFIEGTFDSIGALCEAYVRSCEKRSDEIKKSYQSAGFQISPQCACREIQAQANTRLSKPWHDNLKWIDVSGDLKRERILVALDRNVDKNYWRIVQDGNIYQESYLQTGLEHSVGELRVDRVMVDQDGQLIVKERGKRMTPMCMDATCSQLFPFTLPMQRIRACAWHGGKARCGHPRELRDDAEWTVRDGLLIEPKF